MKLKSLSMPEDFGSMGTWLDNQMVSADLIDTILELEILAGDRITKVQTLDGILAQESGDVMESGLSGASGSTVRALLVQPSLLLELQEQVMMHGGNYWQQKADAAYGKSGPATAVASGSSQSTRGWNSQAKVFGAVAALAAGVLIMFSLTQFGGFGSSVAKSNWGFSKSGLLESNLTESEMLAKLSAASSSWHNKVPGTAEQLETRLREFDFGCQTLLNSNLPQLSASSRNAVHAACERCRQQIAARLAEIKDGARFESVLGDSNETIDQLTNAIRAIA